MRGGAERLRNLTTEPKGKFTGFMKLYVNFHRPTVKQNVTQNLEIIVKSMNILADFSDLWRFMKHVFHGIFGCRSIPRLRSLEKEKKRKEIKLDHERKTEFPPFYSRGNSHFFQCHFPSELLAYQSKLSTAIFLIGQCAVCSEKFHETACSQDSAVKNLQIECAKGAEVRSEQQVNVKHKSSWLKPQDHHCG